MSDPKLEHIRHRADSVVITKSRGLNRVGTKIVKRRDWLYRQFTQGNKSSLQLIVPSSFREKVLKLAHESLMAGHLGIKKTLNRILAELFWPGVCGDVTRFCRSCDICQRTIQKGRVTKVPLGKLPLIDTPFKRVVVDIVGPIQPQSDKKKKIREKSRECHNHKPQPFPDTKRKRKQTKTKQAQIEQTYEKH